MLNLDTLNAYYGQAHVLKQISLKIEERQIASIVGANGAGKTTLLNVISRIVPLKSGRMSFQGVEIQDYPPHRVVELGLIQVPEGRRLFPTLTVLENLELGAYQGHAKQKRCETLGEVFALFPILADRESQTAGTLSGGEQQMLAIGRGLMSLPKLLMLDEPSLGLAPLVVKGIFDTVDTINKTGVTILLVEQNVKKALDISDTGFVLENGEITMTGRGRDIINNEYTKKAFLGM